MIDLYETLGARKTDTPATIKRKYRRKAARLHPDKGGDPVEFKQLLLAYEVLGDETRRRRYDETGSVELPESGAFSVLAEKLQQVLAKYMSQGASLDRADLITEVRSQLRAEISRIRNDSREYTSRIQKLRRAADRMKRKGDGDNLLALVILQPVAVLEEKLRLNQSQIDTIDEAVRLLDDYIYERDQSNGPMTDGARGFEMSIGWQSLKGWKA